MLVPKHQVHLTLMSIVILIHIIISPLIRLQIINPHLPRLTKIHQISQTDYKIILQTRIAPFPQTVLKQGNAAEVVNLLIRIRLQPTLTLLTEEN